MNGGSEAGSGAGTPTGDRDTVTRHEREDSNSVAEDRVELLCNDTILDPNMDLRQVVTHSNIPLHLLIYNLTSRILLL